MTAVADDSESDSAPSREAVLSSVMLCAVTVAALAVQREISGIDALAAACLLSGMIVTERSHDSRLGPLLIAAACALCPLACGATVLLQALRRRSAALAILAVGLIVALARTGPAFVPLRVPAWLLGWSGPADLDRLSTPNVWAEIARRFEPLTALLVLGAIGAGATLSGRHASGSLPPEMAPVLWLIANALALLCAPRYVVGHLLIWIVPAALLAPIGWTTFMRILRAAPSIFLRAVGYAFACAVIWWLYVPLERIRDAILLALLSRT